MLIKPSIYLLSYLFISFEYIIITIQMPRKDLYKIVHIQIFVVIVLFIIDILICYKKDKILKVLLKIKRFFVDGGGSD